MIVQIYEIQSPKEAEAMVRVGVDHIGTVLLPDDGWLREGLRNTVRTVQDAGRRSSLIPLSSDPDAISAALDYYRPDIVHFCENLAGQDVQVDDIFRIQESLRERYPQIRFMRSIPIAPAGADHWLPTLELAVRFAPISDFFLTDTLLVAGPTVDATQPVSGFVGITGITCDWAVAGQLVQESPIPVILAGGLSPGNVRSGIVSVRPAGVDSCTRTNATDGEGAPIRFRKDSERVRQFVESARGALSANG